MEDLDHLRTHSMGLSQGFAFGLRRSDVAELSFLDQFAEGLCRFLDRNIGIYSSTLEQVQLLGSPEVFVDVVDTASQALLTAKLLGYDRRRLRCRTYDASARIVVRLVPPLTDKKVLSAHSGYFS